MDGEMRGTGEKPPPVSHTLWESLRKAGLVAGVAFLSAAPGVHYLSKVAITDGIRGQALRLPERDAVRGDLVSIALQVTIAALVGTFFSERYGLAGAGNLRALKRAGRLVVVLGPLLAILGYVLVGRAYAERVPGLLPESLSWALLLMLKGAIFEEVVCRYGMMTIAMGVSRRLWVANLLQATFFTAVGLKGLELHGLASERGVLLYADLASAFLVHLLQGFVFAKYGLLSSMALHWTREIRLLIHLLFLG